MFSVKLGSIASAKDSALGIFNEALAKLNKAHAKAEQFKKEAAVRQAKAEKKAMLEARDLQLAHSQQADIAKTVDKIKAILG